MYICTSRWSKPLVCAMAGPAQIGWLFTSLTAFRLKHAALARLSFDKTHSTTVLPIENVHDVCSGVKLHVIESCSTRNAGLMGALRRLHEDSHVYGPQIALDSPPWDFSHTPRSQTGVQPREDWICAWMYEAMLAWVATSGWKLQPYLRGGTPQLDHGSARRACMHAPVEGSCRQRMLCQDLCQIQCAAHQCRVLGF